MRNIVVVDDDFTDLRSALKSLGITDLFTINSDDVAVLVDEEYNVLSKDMTAEIDGETIRVLATMSPQKALRLLSEETALLVSDFVMPRFTGAELYHAAVRRFPRLKAIIRSGDPEMAKHQLPDVEIRIFSKRKEDHLVLDYVRQYIAL